MSEAPLWSVLLLVEPRAWGAAGELLANLRFQVRGRRDVELVAICSDPSDPEALSQNLLNAARGTFVSFLGSNDVPRSDYIDLLLGCMSENGDAELVTFDVLLRGQGTTGRLRLGFGHPFEVVPRSSPAGVELRRPPNLMCVWRRDVLLQPCSVSADRSIASAVERAAWRMAQVRRVVHWNDMLVACGWGGRDAVGDVSIL
jgi:hypothetical protein